MSENGYVKFTPPLFSSLAELESGKQLLKLNEKFNSANTTIDLHKIIKEIDSTVSSIDNDLNHLIILKSKKHQQEISNIELNRAKLSNAVNSSSELSTLFSSAKDLGNSLTFKIKSLDQEISNVNSTLNFVKDIQLLRNNINQASYALEHRNWQLAAQCIHTIKSKLSDDLINGQFAAVVIPSADLPELPRVTIEKWVKDLTGIFQTKFNEAAKRRDVPELTKYFQLFPLIDQEEIGLNCYSKFICQIINDTARNLIDSVSNNTSESQPSLYSTMTMQLFENISMMLSQHGPLIKKYYGSTYEGAISYVVTRIQYEVDSQIGLISDTFYDTKRIEKFLQDIKIYNFPILAKRFNDLPDQMNELNIQEDANNELISIVQVGDLVNELASILHHWSLYCKFITLKYYKVDNDEELKLPNLILDSNFTKKIHNKYLPAFESLYTFYFRRSLEKAITIEEIPFLDPYLANNAESTSPDQVPCSSVIEDTTLVLNTTIRNVIDTGMPSTVKNFVVESFKVVKNDLINGFFIKNLNENQPRYNQTLVLVQPNVPSGELSKAASPGISRSNTPMSDPGSGGIGFFKGASSALGNVVGSSSVNATGSNNPSITNNIKLLNFVIYLNTVAMGQEYFSKIFDSLITNNSDYLKNSFTFGKDDEKVSKILKNDFLDPFINITNKIISDSLVNFYNQAFKNKLLGLVNEFFPDSNESNYIIYSSNYLNDTSSILKLQFAWRSLIRPYKQTLHKSLIFSKLLRLLVINLANLIEKKLTIVIKKFKINELGSIKLEKDLSYLINEVCEDNYQLREKFVRVTQLVLLVGMDDDEYEISNQNNKVKNENDIDDDEDDYSGINWVLTPQERKQLRRLRV